MVLAAGPFMVPMGSASLTCTGIGRLAYPVQGLGLLLHYIWEREAFPLLLGKASTAVIGLLGFKPPLVPRFGVA